MPRGTIAPLDLEAELLNPPPQITEDLRTDELRFLNGVLQRQFIIRVRQGMQTISQTEEWRDIPSVTI